MSSLTCVEVEGLAPELALATIPGDERAAVLAHLDRCGGCRRLVKELSDTADALLLLAPEMEPPAGLARKVSRTLNPPRIRSWRKVIVAATVALLAGLALGILPGMLRGSGTTMVRIASFTPTGSETLAGQVYARAHDPSWVFMTVHDTRRDAGSTEIYTCELVLRNGDHVSIGSFAMRDGSGSWGRAIGVKVSEVRSVALLTPQGAVAASAVLSG